MADQGRKPDRRPLPMRASSDARHTRGSRRHDREAQLAQAKPRSQTEPTTLAVPNLIYRMRNFRRSRIPKDPPSPTQFTTGKSSSMDVTNENASGLVEPSFQTGQNINCLEKHANNVASDTKSPSPDAERSYAPDYLQQCTRLAGISDAPERQVVRIRHAFSASDLKSFSSSMIEQAMRLSAARSVRPRALSSSFASYTLASMAKQNEKVGLLSFSKASSTKQTAGWPNIAQAHVISNGSTAHTSRSREHGSYFDEGLTEETALSSATDPALHSVNSSSATSSYLIAGVHVLPTADSVCMQSSLLGNEAWLKEREDLLAQVELLKQNIVELEQNKKTCIIDFEASNKEKRASFDRLSEQLQQYEQRLEWFRQQLLRYKTRTEMRVVALEQQNVFEDNSETAFKGARYFGLDSLYKSFDAVENELAKFGKEKEAMEAEVQTIERQRDETSRQLEALRAELRLVQSVKRNGELENDKLGRSSTELYSAHQDLTTHNMVKAENEDLQIGIAETQHKLRKAYMELARANLRTEQAVGDLQAFHAALDTLQIDTEQILNCADLGSQNISSGNPISWDMLESFAQSPNDFHVNSRRSRLDTLQLIHRLGANIHAVRTKNRDLQSLSSDKNHNLIVTASPTQREGNSGSSPVLEEKSVCQTNSDTFEQRFRKERQERMELEYKFRRFRETVERRHQPNLGSTNRALHVDLTRTHGENIALREMVKKYQARTYEWENEYNLAVSELDQRTVAFERRVQEQQNEILFYIKEYHDKTHDPQHWNLEDLQIKVRALERQLQTTNEEFGHVKRDKIRLEDEVAQLINANKRREKDITRLGRAWITGSATPTLVDTTSSAIESDDSASESTSSTSLLWLSSPKLVNENPRVPHCHFPVEMGKREERLPKLRSEQKQRREEFDDREVERGRRLKRGPSHPVDSFGRKDVMKKDVWERWGE